MLGVPRGFVDGYAGRPARVCDPLQSGKYREIRAAQRSRMEQGQRLRQPDG